MIRLAVVSHLVEMVGAARLMARVLVGSREDIAGQFADKDSGRTDSSSTVIKPPSHRAAEVESNGLMKDIFRPCFLNENKVP